MHETIAVTGVVLAVSPVGEFDRRVVLLTRELGKISAFARGARKQNSPLLAGTRTFAFGVFALYAGRNSYTLQSTEIKEYFSELSLSAEAVSYGCYFLEVADYFTREGSEESQMVNLIFVTLKALLNPNLDNRLIRRVYEFRALVLNGEYPSVFACAECGKELTEGIFSYTNGMVYGLECSRAEKSGYHLQEAAVYALQYIVSAAFGKLYTFVLKPDILKEVEEVVSWCMNYYVGRKFQSLSVLEAITT